MLNSLEIDILAPFCFNSAHLAYGRGEDTGRQSPAEPSYGRAGVAVLRW
jgi:hypothetical protein